MRPSPLFFILSTIFTSTFAQSFHPPAALVHRGVPATLLKPRFGKNLLEKRDLEPARNPLARLLRGRQDTGCPDLFEACGADCCPAAGDCCAAAGGCCPDGQFCYGTGCCSRLDFGCADTSCCPNGSNCCSDGGCCAGTDACVTVNGQPGCCPEGQTCSGAAVGCSLSGYVQCANDDYCCLPGDTCFRDVTGAPGCAGPDGSSLVGPPPSTSPNVGGVSSVSVGAGGGGTAPTGITFQPEPSSINTGTSNPLFPSPSSGRGQQTNNPTSGAIGRRMSEAVASLVIVAALLLSFQ